MKKLLVTAFVLALGSFAFAQTEATTTAPAGDSSMKTETTTETPTGKKMVKKEKTMKNKKGKMKMEKKESTEETTK